MSHSRHSLIGGPFPNDGGTIHNFIFIIFAFIGLGLLDFDPF